MSNLRDCLYLSDFADYDLNTPLSYSHQNLKAKLNISNNHIIVNTEFIPTKYFDLIKANATSITLTELELKRYRFQPKKFCYERYGTVELWALLLRLNNMTSITEFSLQTFKVPPSNIIELLNEMIIIEQDAIDKNNESIE